MANTDTNLRHSVDDSEDPADVPGPAGATYLLPPSFCQSSRGVVHDRGGNLTLPGRVWRAPQHRRR